ncbi:ATP-dependent DNA helicase Q5-like [Acyrthosiphon pisum]|uniref:DEAD/DEAH-box helicase domain-containing protein n=1 Tax=Acyrthosiphon pisum TaxID=7029 RepID=A0A8R2NMK8_ACYPI|nr:ATP-dependent DNA helicase Q5-like [Acyrthosiphon pisum]
MTEVNINYDNIPKSAPEDSILNALLEDYFSYKHFKSKTQRNAIVKILKRESDVIVSLPKGHGRTTCFQLPIVISSQKVAIVVVGVSSRIEKQISRLNRTDVYAEHIHVGMSSEEYDDIKTTINDLSNIRSTLNSILYVTPDVVPTANFHNLLHHLNDRNSLGYIVVDLSYCENDWLTGLTEDRYALDLGALRDEFMDTSWVVTTEKARPEFIDHIKSTLRLRTRRADIPRDAIPWFSMDIEADDVLLDR